MALRVHEEDQMEMDSTEMWYIMTRMQQLQSRRSLLLELQEFLKRNNFREGKQVFDEATVYEKIVTKEIPYQLRIDGFFSRKKCQTFISLHYLSLF